ncbi:MAG: tetratricopeptide repeat protein [Spirochaetia bacterium]|nr:tetratricopeptide repeat protein [Spirochaetia bacterium]
MSAMLRNNSYIFIFILAITSGIFSESIPLHAFRDYGTSNALKMEILGQVTSKSHMFSLNRPRLLDYDTREMIISAKLYENQGIRIGDTIYIIQKDPDHQRYLNGLIIGKATVFSIFQTEFQGWMLKARGNLSMIKKGHYIARLDFGSQRNQALEYLRKGDKYKELGDYAQSYLWYKKSLDMDEHSPETYLKLAQLAFQQGIHEQAVTFINEAWKRSAKLEDPNDMLELPGFFLSIRMEQLRSIASQEKRLKELLSLLKEIRDYSKHMNWISFYIQDEYKSMLEKAGIPEYSYQYGIANLFNEIYLILKGNNVNRILAWVSKSERDILFEPIYMAYKEEPFQYPKKSWDLAYFEASLYHYRMANELNELDTRASYEIIMMCFDKLKSHPSMKDGERMKNLIAEYGKYYIRVPDVTDHYARIQNVLNTFNQF